MFEVGFVEMLMIFALALIVLGPEKLPKLAQQVGRWVGRARNMARQFREQLETESIDLETVGEKRSNKSSASAATPKQYPEEDESSYYPADHHAHPEYQAPAATTPAEPSGMTTAEPSAQPVPSAEASPPPPAASSGQMSIDFDAATQAPNKP
jgi:sec-independent protein translocase protein TatB